MAIRAADCCSPVAASASSSRGSGCFVRARARSSSSSVLSPAAETTVTTRFPRRRASRLIPAARRRRSGSARELPPNFCTINMIVPPMAGASGHSILLGRGGDCESSEFGIRSSEFNENVPLCRRGVLCCASPLRLPERFAPIGGGNKRQQGGKALEPSLPVWVSEIITLFHLHRKQLSRPIIPNSELRTPN